MSNFAPKRTTYDSGDTRWLRDALRAESHGVTLSGDSFTSDAAGFLIKSGTHIAKVTSTGLGAPYNGTSEEIQTLTEGGSGLTSFTITWNGQTTAAIDDDATAAQVQAALEALSNIGVGDVEVTGGPLGTGPFTVKFVGSLKNTDVAAMTTTPTPTGGTGTVVVATATAGGAATDSPAGTGKSVGHLRNDLLIKPGEKHLVAVVHAGTVDRRYLPTVLSGGHDAAAEADLTAIAYIN